MDKEEIVGSTAKLLSQAWVAWQWEDTYLDLDISDLVSDPATGTERGIL